jgi:hypothetical protein
VAKVVGKGSVVQHTISASLTAIAQVLSVELSGSKSNTFDSKALDSGVFGSRDLTGYSDPGTVSLELFYDAALAGHQFITDNITTPAKNAMKIIYANTTEQLFTSCGVAFGASIVMDDGVKGSATYEIDGTPGWPT